MHRAPPPPRGSSEPSIATAQGLLPETTSPHDPDMKSEALTISNPSLSRASRVWMFLAYVRTFPGANAKKLAPLCHCSLSWSQSSSPPQITGLRSIPSFFNAGSRPSTGLINPYIYGLILVCLHYQRLEYHAFIPVKKGEDHIKMNE